MKLKRYGRDAAIVVIVIFAISWWQTRDMVASGDDAPALSGPTLTGQTFDLQQHRGQTVLLYFFAPWCGVCKVSAGNLAWVKRLVHSEETVIAAVALDYESRASIDAFINSVDIGDVPVVVASDVVRDAYKIAAYPSYYVIKADGTVAFASVGYSTLLGMLIRTWLG